MKMVHPDFVFQIELLENRINEIIIEDPARMGSYTRGLYEQCNGSEGAFVLSNDTDILNISKHCIIVTDLISFELNKKKLLNELYRRLKTVAEQESYYLLTCEIRAALLNYMNTIMVEVDLPLEITKDIDLTALFRAVDMGFAAGTGTIAEALTEYMLIFRELGDISFFIIVNAKAFLTTEELKLLFDFVSYQKINLLLLESHYSKTFDEREKIYIVDKDGCELFRDD